MPGFGRESKKNPSAKASQGRWSQSIEHLKTEARKSIWFAFQTLTDHKSEMVQTHTLKVLTASIGNALGIEKSEELHDKTEELDFHTYFNLIESVMFDPLSKASTETMDLSSINSEDVHNVCWVLFYNHEKGKSIPQDFDEGIAFKMWIMFNLFAEEDESGIPILPLKIDPEEATIIIEAILSQTGNKNSLSKAIESLGEEPVSFQKYLGDFYTSIYSHVKEAVLKLSIDTVYEQLVLDILKKGFVSKRGHQVKNWKERYMVLTPKELKYYVSSHKRHMKGTIVFDKSHSVELLPDRGGRRNLFVLTTQQKPYEMSAMDMKTRNEWMAGIQVGIDHCEDDNYHHNKELSKVRRQKRNLKRKEKEEEERRRKEGEENQKKVEDEYKQRELMNEETLKQKLKELQDEKKARAELEAMLREQNELREAERKRLQELEASKSELEKLLELERQAKRDEETVRKLQAKLLEEESEKREELERLKKEQETLLQQEREMREGLEGQWEEKDKILTEAQHKLSRLESERLEASDKLEEATQRLQQAEIERHKMEEKVKLWKKPNVGLARPIQPVNTKLVTHRGEGAFCAADFLKRSRLQDRKRGMTKEQLDEKYGPHVEDMDSDEEGIVSMKSSVSPTTVGDVSTNKNVKDIDKISEKPTEKVSLSDEKDIDIISEKPAEVKTTDHIASDQNTTTTENNENQSNESSVDDKMTEHIVNEKTNVSKIQDERREVKNEHDSKIEETQIVLEADDNSVENESLLNGDDDSSQAKSNAEEECLSSDQGNHESSEKTDDIISENQEEQKTTSEKTGNENDKVVQSQYENVTFDCKAEKSEEIKNSGNIEHSQSDEIFVENNDSNKIDSKNSEDESEKEQSSPDIGRKSLPSFSNELYENVSSDGFQKKPEDKCDSIEEDDSTDTYDYVDMKKQVW